MPKIIKNKIKKFDYENDFENFLNFDKTNLKLWLDMSDSPSDRSDYASEASAISYEGSATSTNELIGTQYYNAARFDNSENINALVTYSSGDNPVSFTDGAGNDKPFTISLLYKRSSTDSDTLFENFFAKSDGTSSNVAYDGGYGIAGGLYRLIFYIYTNSSNYIRSYNTVSQIEDDVWHHFVFTYDGNKTVNSLKVYINGVDLTVNNQVGGTYSGMSHTGERLYVGASSTGINEADGQISEFTIIDRELNVAEINILKKYLFEGVSSKGSGYITNPARTIIRDRDNQLNTYPRVKRSGYNEVESSYTLSGFDDNNTIIYGKTISDDFNMDANSLDQFKKPVDSSKWLVSSEEIYINKEDLNALQGRVNPTPPSPGALSFRFGSERWLRTVDKVKNPTLRFKVVQGEYKFANSRALNLDRGTVTDLLGIQISSDGTSWEDIELEARNISNPAVRLVSGKLDPTSPLLTLENRKYLVENLDRFWKQEYSVNVHPDQLRLSSDPNASFYIRIIQENTSDENKAFWAISNISIVSREQSIVGQTGLTLANQNHLSSSYASPNLLTSFTQQNGISLSHVSNNLFTRNEDNPSIIPFSDNRHVINDANEFYQYGVSEKVYPGFDSPLSSKKIIEVDLSTQESIDLLRLNNSAANAARHAITGSGDLGSNIMVYWNKDLKRWEKIGWPIGVNDFGGATTSSNIVNILSSSAVGFSSCGVMVSGSEASSAPDTTAVLLPDDLLNSYNRPTDTFGFPYSGRYYATGSQYILAKDIGITKPFIFEKAVLDFQMSGRVNYDFGGFDAIYLQNKYYNESTGTPAVRHGTPTFFILRQKKESFNPVKISTFTGSKENDTVSYTESLPSFYQLNSSSNDLTYVEESRELVTYGQHTIIISSSFATTNYTPSVSFDAFLKSAIVRDGHTIFNTTNDLVTQQTYFTGSFKIEFPCRATARISPFSPYYVVNTPGGSLLGGSGYSTYANIRMGKQLSGRSSGGLDKEGRSLVNGFSAFTPSDNNISIQYVDTPQTAAGSYFTNPVVVAKGDSVDLISPYVVMPEDKLIFGWQAPLSFRRISADLDSSYITLFGKSNLRLYGSEIKDNKQYIEGLNQNLTTNAIHEAIGNDPVLDQFQIASRGEITGSYGDTIPVDLTSAQGPAVIVGRNLTNEETDGRLITRGGPQIPWTRLSFVPKNRLGILNYTISNLDSFALNPIIKSFIPSSGFNVNLVDLSRVFSDSRYKLTDSYYFSTTNPSEERPEYGSMQNIVANSGGGEATKLGGGPKYYFSAKHYGYFIDMIRQGLDSRFVDDPTTTDDDTVTDPAVKIQFVTSEYDEATMTRRYLQIRPEAIEGTSEKLYQSSNLSVFATSSYGYIDNDTPTNRTYGEFELVVE